MLRYLYTSEYERAGSMDGTMDREVCHEHLSVAAVADKYGITTLTEDALDKLRIDSCFLHGEEVSEIVLEAMEKIRSPDSLKEYILRMLELRFADCMQCGVLREWVEKQPGLEERLVRQNIVKAMKDQGFRTELAKDGERAVRYLQYQTQCLDTESWGSPRSPSP